MGFWTGIPDGKLYMDGELGAGTVATIEDAKVNTEMAGADVGFGQGVVVKDGKAAPATKGPIYGIALKRTYVNGDHFLDETIQGDKWKAGEVLGVLREGTIAVPLSADVNKGENATVDNNGNFKPAGASDPVVGFFVSAGNQGGTANMQTTIQLANSNVTGNGLETVPATPATSNSGTSTAPSTNTPNSSAKQDGGK